MKELKISAAQFYKIKNSDIILRIRRKLVKNWFQDDIPDVLLSLRNNALTGDPRSAKVFLEYVDEDFADTISGGQKTPLTKNEINIIISDLRGKKL
jgi:hypothetical protein